MTKTHEDKKVCEGDLTTADGTSNSVQGRRTTQKVKSGRAKRHPFLAIESKTTERLLNHHAIGAEATKDARDNRLLVPQQTRKTGLVISVSARHRCPINLTNEVDEFKKSPSRKNRHIKTAPTLRDCASSKRRLGVTSKTREQRGLGAIL